MSDQLDRVKFTTSTTGSSGSSIEVGSAYSAAYFTPTEAGAVDGWRYTYVIQQGNDIEIQQDQVWTASGATIARGTPARSKIGGTAGTSKINLDGSAVVAFGQSATDILAAVRVDDAQSFTTGEKTQALDNLGGTTVGKAVFVAADEAAARAAAAAAPRDPQFIVAATNSELTAELVLTNTPSITWDTATPGQMKANVAAHVATIKISKFTASGTYTPDAKMLYATIECVGGGAAGGGTSGLAGHFVAGGGGGAGGYSRKVVTAADVGASKAVTIGGNGTGSSGAAGGAGSATSVGTLCVANGGSGGGAAVAAGASGIGGSGGTSVTGDITATGAPGANGLTSASASLYMSGANGASTLFGAGARGSTPSGSGSVTGNAAAANTGAGGGGSVSFDSATSGTGGAGGSGLVVVTEYCSL